jgi:hypothetical protein
MLSLAPPYYIYQGVPVFADAQDPYQFFYLPNQPHFAVDEQSRPVVRFIALKDDPDAPATDDQVTGFFFFDTSLDWPAETLTSVARKIQADHDLDRVPRLVPLLYRKGTARLMFLDQMTPDPNAPPDNSGGSPSGTAAGDGTDAVTPGQKWVTLLESSVVPSLYGENRAIFSAVLTKKATQLLYGAFDGFVPAGVVYDLTFDGLQPAFHIHVDVDWHQVYTYLKTKYAPDFLFFRSDVENIAQKLEDAQIIHFDAAILGVGDEGLQGQFNDAKKQLTDFVLDNFFKPAPNPNKPDTSTQDGIISVIQAIRDLGSPVDVSYQRIDLTDDELRTLTIDYDIAVAVERHIAPQGNLSMFFGDYHLKRDDVVTVVNTADSIFRSADFQVMVSAPFTDDAIDAVTVDVAYGQPSPPPANAELWSFLFRNGNDVQKHSGWYNPAVGDQAQYRYETVFHPTPMAGPELKLDSGWKPSRGSAIMVTPDELYQRRTLEVQIDDGFPFDSYPSVQVQLRYSDQSSGWTHEDGAVLDKGHRTWTPAFRIHRDWSTGTQVKLTYLHPAGNLEKDWVTTDSDRLDIVDPRTNLMTVQVIVAGNRDEIVQIVVDLRYEDPANNIFEQASFNLDPTMFAQTHDWTFPRANLANDRYTYSQVVVTTGGETITTGDVQGNSTQLLVGPIYAKKWVVQPQLVGPAFDQTGLDKVTVELHYEDTANNYASDKTVVFTAPGAGTQWPLDLRDASKRQYTYKATYEDKSGFDKVLGPVATTGGKPDRPRGPPPWRVRARPAHPDRSRMQPLVVVETGAWNSGDPRLTGAAGRRASRHLGHGHRRDQRRHRSAAALAQRARPRCPHLQHHRRGGRRPPRSLGGLAARPRRADRPGTRVARELVGSGRSRDRHPRRPRARGARSRPRSVEPSGTGGRRTHADRNGPLGSMARKRRQAAQGRGGNRSLRGRRPFRGGSIQAGPCVRGELRALPSREGRRGRTGAHERRRAWDASRA